MKNLSSFSKSLPWLRTLGILWIAVSTLGTGCGSPSIKNSSGSLPTAALTRTPLTEIEAIKRASQVSNVIYSLWFGLEETLNDFSGRATIQFELDAKAKAQDEELFLDFSDAAIHSISVNGSAITDLSSSTRYDGNRIHFKMKELYAGTNRIEIEFRHTYNHNGHGLHRFLDPADHAVYLYSDLEPNYAHEIFPNFDQPDLKAKIDLKVEAPAAWQIVSNNHENAVTVNATSGLKTWVFPQSLPISTYIFALIAGNYTSWSADADGIPMRLFARQSLKKYVDYKEWFDITRKGLKFYAKQFGRPYPFPKYDQILVPEFDEGAMENAGAVTHSERTIYRTKVTKLSHEDRADTILHEMAHMWFGDLVTMKWWNGLWLNESFATFMASWAMSETLPIQGMNHETAWELFTHEKQSAYWQDQLVTTHPIESKVENTDQAFANFDGITYGKGASVIKQLRYFLGEENFRKGIQLYFQKFAFGNTRLEDFIGSLSTASGVDLNDWQKVWLTTAGVNSLKTEWSCKAGKISKFTLWQAPAEVNAVIRPHRTAVGFYSLNSKSGKFEIKNSLPVTYEKKETQVAAALGLPCPDFIYPNANDDDYVKVELDPKSLETVSAHLSKIISTLARHMIWNTLWEMVTDGKLAPKDYADLAMKQLPEENDIQTQGRVIGNLVSTGLDAPTVLKYIRPSLRADYQNRIEAFSLKNFKSVKPGSDLQLVFFDSLLVSAHTPKVLDYLRNILNGKVRVPGLKIDQEVRWDVVRNLARNGAKDAEALISRELAKDQTDIGKRNAIAARVVIPDLKIKNEWMDKVVQAAPTGNTKELSGADLRTVMTRMNIAGQEKLSEQLVDRYFSELPKAVKSPEATYVGDYTDRFYPGLCTQKIIDLTAAALKLDMPMNALKHLRVHKQEEERCLRARSL